MIWVCGCGLVATKVYELALRFNCPVCASKLEVKEDLPLSFWNKHSSFIDLDEDFLNPKRKAILTAIKTISPCSDRMISVYLNEPINRVTARRNELSNCSIPFIVPFDKVFDKDTNRFVTHWVVNKNLVDVERLLEVKNHAC